MRPWLWVNLSGFAIAGLLLVLGFYVWPGWPIQNRATQVTMWSARIVGVLVFAINFIVAVTWLVRLATGR
jgi:hypothetical protein